jgi:diguanylate cyclase (GGDEF)-like protein
MFDIDHFKQVNDNYGHDIGDKVLIKITNEVSKTIRETDIFARWGGEEFMILTPDTNLESAIGLAERTRRNIEMEEINKVGQITCSFGVTCFKKGDTFNSFVKRADNALYQDKESGRNKVININ